MEEDGLIMIYQQKDCQVVDTNMNIKALNPFGDAQ